MSFSRKLHDAEKLGPETVHVVAKRLKAGVQDLSAGLRNLHLSRKVAQRQPVSAHPAPEQERENAVSREGRTGIVSVNGRDIGEVRCTGGRRPA